MGWFTCWQHHHSTVLVQELTPSKHRQWSARQAHQTATGPEYWKSTHIDITCTYHAQALLPLCELLAACIFKGPFPFWPKGGQLQAELSLRCEHMTAVNTCFSRALLVCLPSQKLYSSFSPMSQHSTGGSCFHRTTVLEGPGMTARYQVGCLRCLYPNSLVLCQIWTGRVRNLTNLWAFQVIVRPQSGGVLKPEECAAKSSHGFTGKLPSLQFLAGLRFFLEGLLLIPHSMAYSIIFPHIFPFSLYFRYVYCGTIWHILTVSYQYLTLTGHPFATPSFKKQAIPLLVQWQRLHVLLHATPNTSINALPGCSRGNHFPSTITLQNISWPNASRRCLQNPLHRRVYVRVCVCEGRLLAFRASRFIQATSRNIAKNCSPGSGFKKCLSHFGPFDFASNDWRLWAWQLGGMSCDGMWKIELGKLAHAFCIPSCSYRVFSLSHIAIWWLAVQQTQCNTVHYFLNNSTIDI